METPSDRLRQKISHVLEHLVSKNNYPLNRHAARRAFVESLNSAHLNSKHLTNSRTQEEFLLFYYHFKARDGSMIPVKIRLPFARIGRNQHGFENPANGIPDFSLGVYRNQLTLLEDAFVVALTLRQGVSTKSLYPGDEYSYGSRSDLRRMFNEARESFDRKITDFIRTYNEQALMSVLGESSDLHQEGLIIPALIKRFDGLKYVDHAQQALGVVGRGGEWGSKRPGKDNVSYLRKALYDKSGLFFGSYENVPLPDHLLQYIAAEFLYDLSEVKGYPLSHLGGDRPTQVSSFYKSPFRSFKPASEVKWDFSKVE